MMAVSNKGGAYSVELAVVNASCLAVLTSATVALLATASDLPLSATATLSSMSIQDEFVTEVNLLL